MTEMRLSVENVGGIESVEMTFDEGVALITGKNASNKSSLLSALLFALGADDVPVRTGADRAVVELSIGETVVRREASRDGRGLSVSGEAFVDEEDTTLFMRFAGLLESNPLRTAVQTNTEFEDLLKEPMDISALERQREQQLDRKRTLQRRLDELSDIDSDIETTESTLEERRCEATTLSAELDDLYDDLPKQEDEPEELRQRRTERVAERERLTSQIEDLEAAVDRIDANIEEAVDDLSDAEAAKAEYDLGSLRQERSELRDELDDIDERIDILQQALTANREMLETDMRGLLEYEAGLSEDSLECWACGQQRPVSEFESAVERLTALIEQEKDKRREYEPQIASLEDEIAAAQEAHREVSRLEEKLQSMRANRESRISSLEEKREQAADVADELAEIDAEIEAQRSERADEHSEASQQIEETRVELETKRREIERLESKLDSLVEKQEERAEKEAELAELTDNIRELTNRIENLESDLRNSFNDAMDELIGVLAFDDIERMWLDGDFELVIARDIDGSVQEDSIDNLAESERASIGLVLGLAGYLAYDVADIAPVLVLDSLGAFDAERTNLLVDYFGENTAYLVAAIHPEQVEEDGHDHQLELAPGQR